MRRAFFDDPLLSSRQAGELVHELVDLLAHSNAVHNPALVRRGLQLAAFFSAAHREDLQVRGHSD